MPITTTIWEIIQHLFKQSYKNPIKRTIMLKEEKNRLFTIPIIKFIMPLLNQILRVMIPGTAMWEEANIINTLKETLDISTTFSAWLTNLGTDAAKSESAEHSQATNALPEDNPRKIGFDLIYHLLSIWIKSCLTQHSSFTTVEILKTSIKIILSVKLLLALNTLANFFMFLTINCKTNRASQKILG